MNRRNFLRNGGLAVVVAPVLGARAVLEVTKPTPTPLPPVVAGRVMTAQAWNELVTAVNELRAVDIPKEARRER
jgi:hypothetical protein